MTELAPLRVLVLAGGRSSEHDISVASGASVSAALDPDRYDVVGVTIGRDGTWQLEEPAAEGERLALDPGSSSRSVIPRAGGTLSQVRAVGPIDVVIPMLHGPYGEDGTVQGMLELLDIPYVGSGVLGSALTMDKDRVKVVLAAAGIATARSVLFRARSVLDVDVEAELARAGIGLPCFVKPARLGSSVGISKVTGIDGLRPALDLALQHDSKVLVEEMVGGIEVECGVLGNDNPIVSPPGRLHVNADWYDYAAKYEPDGMDLEVPADIPDGVAEELRRVCLSAFEVCECAGMARIDFFVTDDERVVLNEINTIPGFTETSVYARLFEASGIGYPELLDRLVTLAVERHAEESRFRH
jgi:D-alanine-D-alanine ligase